jgi:hypothetical protein
MAEAESSNPIKSTSEIEKNKAGIVNRWAAELDLATTSEEQWRKESESAWKLYRSKDPRSHSFNILWSNTETMRPALYNSVPRADVRRRFRDADPVGKVTSSVLERGLTFSIDAYDFDNEMALSILDMLIPGRGVARVKYVPTIQGDDDDAQVTNETALCEHVHWKDFRHGPGKTWTEVRWIGFRHDFTRDECVDQFGEEIADKLEYAERGKFSDDSRHNDDVKALLKTVDVWEFWDKDTRKTHFICLSYKDGPLKTVGDTLKLKDFFPIPRPLYAIEDTESLVPQIPYEMYKNQAEELNDITYRLRRITKALKVRGAYAAHLSEVGKIIDADDSEMIPVENASLIGEIGGFEKAIWIMPIDKLVQVFEALIEGRKEVIQTIYEITGLGDIMRGVSNPHETLGAQQLKSQWGSLRLQRQQREVQRFIRDILRLKAEIMSEHFDVKTFMAMTGIALPTAEQKQQAQQILQAAAQAQAAPQAPPQPGAPPAPPAAPQVPPEAVDAAQSAMKLPTWDEVMQLLKSDYMRQYRIDIETDSTIQETLTKDVQGFTETVTGIINLFTGMGPAVQMGLLSVEVVKQLAMSAARMSRMGQAVEDALEQIKQPPPQPPQQDNSVDVAKIEAESNEKMAAHSEQTKLQVSQMQEQSKQSQLQASEQTKGLIAQMQMQNQQQIAQMQEQTKVVIADMQAKYDAQFKQLQEQTKAQLSSDKLDSEEHRHAQTLQSQERTTAAQIEANAAVAADKTQQDAQVKTDTARMNAEASVSNASTAADASRDNAQTAAKAKAAQPKPVTKKK